MKSDMSLLKQEIDKERERECLEIKALEDTSSNGHLSESDINKAVESQQDGDAWLFCRLYKDELCYDHAAGKWYEYTRHYWREDRVNETLTKLDSVIDIYSKEASKYAWIADKASKNKDIDGVSKAQKRAKDFFRKIALLQRKSWKENVLQIAAAGERSLGITGEEWDRDPWTLGCINGVIDLQKGTFRDGRQLDYIKTVCPTAWSGINTPCPILDKFLNDTFNEKPNEKSEIISFIQRLFGYAITGLTTEHILPIFWGQGWNGKGTLLETIAYVLGPLAGPIQSEMLLDQGRLRSSAGPVSDIMALKGKRITWGSETDEGRKLNAGKVKWLVGGDTLCGREPYGRREISFKPTHTLFLLTNHKPKADPNDYALWRRIYLIPFTISFVDNPQKENERPRDPDIAEKLKAEASGILAWLVRGCIEWQKQGLNPPISVKSATEKYQEAEDIINYFMSDCCILSASAQVQAGQLYKKYKSWCEENGHKYISGTKFGELMKKRFESEKTNTVKYFGIGLSNNE